MAIRFFFNWAKRAVSIQNIYIQFFQCRKHAVFVLHIRIENVWRAVFIQIKKLLHAIFVHTFDTSNDLHLIVKWALFLKS